MTESRDIKINVPVLARVEGEGALSLDIRDGRIERLELRIFEPPRMFEKFLEGRSFEELPDTVARICGICPVAYQMSAVQATERAFGVEPDPWVSAMRRVLYCGEWIQSHALHIHLLAAPDFLGFENAIEMSAQHADLVRRGLRLQELGNRVIGLFGGRSVHPVGVRVGGFHRAPASAAVEALARELEQSLPEALALLRWTLGLKLPARREAFISVALRHEEEYPLMAGRLAVGDQLEIDIADYPRYFRELQAPHSTALHSLFHQEGIDQGDGQPYLVGPLARLNLNFQQLPGVVQTELRTGGLSAPSQNLFHSVVARAAEIYLAIDEAARLLRNYTMPARPYIEVKPRQGEAAGCTEAPRGTLWHQYAFDPQGRICRARIVPPTSQNQARIEADLRDGLETFGLDRPEDDLRKCAETIVRNYDPCISCATHFLRVKVRRV